jgi:hypothetical protein
VKPFRHKVGSWLLTLPKDVITEAGLEKSLEKGTKVPVYFDKEKRELVYMLPYEP